MTRSTAPTHAALVAQLEQLTDEERVWLNESCRDGLEHKCLRIIDAQAAERATLVAQVARLKRERGESDRLEKGELARVRELTQALAAAERKAASWERGHDHAWELKVAAEARVRELEARDQGASEPPRELSPRELREMYDIVLKDAEKAEALAAEWQQSARDAQADLAVLRTEHDKLKARVERALIVRAQRGALSEGAVIDHMTEALKGNQ